MKICLMFCFHFRTNGATNYSKNSIRQELATMARKSFEKGMKKAASPKMMRLRYASFETI